VIVQLFSETYGRGYLPKYAGNPVATFFSTSNVAFRRQLLAELGGFDETLLAGEDIDICLRAAKSRWELFFTPAARVEHWARDDVRGLFRQWWGYGFYHARLFAKHTGRAIELLVLNPNPRAHTRFAVLFFRARSPVRAIVFVSSFAVMHLALAVGALPVAAAAAAVYLEDDLPGPGGLVERLRHAALRYVVNAALVGGGLAGGLREGYLFVYGTLWKRRG
jgi:cellulose synthase/poly-beta-1,6-N-acetylglucosamine synthase-like glycosyltransferase